MAGQPHDSVFKLVFEDVEHARGELRTALPEALAAVVDWSRLALVPGTFITPELAGSHTDLLFTAPLRGDRELFIYVLCEHRSTPDPIMPFRMMAYTVDIVRGWLRGHERATKVPAVVPLVVHHGPGGWTAPKRMHEVIDLDEEVLEAVAPYLPSFELLLDDLWKADDASLLARAMTDIGRLALLILKHAGVQAELLTMLERWLTLLGAAFASGRHLDVLDGMMRYTLLVNEGIQVAELAQIVGRTVGKSAEENVMATGQQLIEEGRKVGRSEGRKEGRAEGARAVVLRLLGARFGAVPDDAEARVEAATADELERWAERLLTASSLDDVFGPS